MKICDHLTRDIFFQMPILQTIWTRAMLHCCTDVFFSLGKRCNLTFKAGTFLLGNTMHENEVGATDLEYCLDSCSTDPDCWATYFSPVISFACVSYKATYPTYLKQNLVYIGVGGTYLKTCVQGACSISWFIFLKSLYGHQPSLQEANLMCWIQKKIDIYDAKIL